MKQATWLRRWDFNRSRKRLVEGLIALENRIDFLERKTEGASPGSSNPVHVRHRIRYLYEEGDVLTYIKDISLLSEEPDGSRLDGTAQEEMIQKVVAQEGNISTIHLSMKTLESQGPLAGHIPEELLERETMMKMDDRGSLLEMSAGVVPPQVPAFPLDELSASQTWVATVPAPGSGQPFQVQYALESFAEEDGEVLAQLVTVGTFRNGEEDYDVETQSSTTFSITYGHQISSTSVVKMVWSNGRISHTVIELDLESRINLND